MPDEEVLAPIPDEDPPYVDNSPPAAPDEEEPEPAFQPRNDVVIEDPEAETAAGTEPVA